MKKQIKIILLTNVSHPDVPTMQISKGTKLTKQDFLDFLKPRTNLEELYKYALKEKYIKEFKS